MLVIQMANKPSNSLDGVDGLSVQVNRVAAPVREQVFDQLRQAIVEMRLKPEQRLVERELIQQTGVSRTTIREVLRQLAAEGLVTTIPHKGTVVASPSVERAAELYEVRAVLEGMAARQFAERATDVHMRALRRAFEGIEKRARSGQANSQAMLEAKKHFYDALFEGAANGTIQDIVESLQARVTVLRAASMSQPGRSAKTVEEVRAIVEALERRDGDAAAAACVHHVNEAARTVFEAMAAAADDDAA
jgi:DNA-binding GntR family transcriptional regulator